MLESLRNAGKSWVAKILLVLLAGSFAVWGIQDIFGGFQSTALATVGNQEISTQKFDESFRTALQNLSRQTGRNLTAEEARQIGFDRNVLDNLLESAAIDAQAEQLELKVSPQYIARDAMDNQAFKGTNGQFDPERFARVLQQNGMNEETFIASEMSQRIRSAIVDVVDKGVVVPKTMLDAIHKYQSEQRDAKYFKITATEADVKPPTDDELKKQYDATPAAYTSPEFRSIAVLKVEPADIASKISISDADLQAGYEKYKKDYFTPERRTVLQIAFPSIDEAKKVRDTIASTTDFIALGKSRGLSEADMTFANQTKSQFLDRAIADAAFSLKEGEVSAPVAGSLVTAVLKVVKITPEKQSGLAEVKNDLAKRLQNERATQEIEAIYETVENAFNSQTSFEEISKQQNIPLTVIPAVSSAGLDPSGNEVSLPNKSEILKAAFQSDVGVQNLPLNLNDGFFWYDVREVKPSAIKPFDSVKEQVKSDVIARKTRELLSERAAKLVEKLKTGTTIESLASEAGSDVKAAQGLKRNEANAEFDVAAIAALFSVKENGAAFSLEGDGKAAKIMQSQTVISTPLDFNSAEAKQLVASLKDQKSKDILASYLTALKNQVGVTVNDTLWQRTSGTPPANP